MSSYNIPKYMKVAIVVTDEQPTAMRAIASIKGAKTAHLPQEKKPDLDYRTAGKGFYPVTIKKS